MLLHKADLELAAADVAVVHEFDGVGRLLARRERHVPVPVKVDIRLPGKGNSNSHGARGVHLIITMIKWIRTSRLCMRRTEFAACSPVANAMCPYLTLSYLRLIDLYLRLIDSYLSI